MNIEKLQCHWRASHCRLDGNNNVVAVLQFITTWGLLYGVREHDYDGRYCFKNYNDAVDAFNEQDVINVFTPPYDLQWIKHKGQCPDFSPSDIWRTYRGEPIEYEDTRIGGKLIAEHCQQIIDQGSVALIEALEGENIM